MGHVLVAHAILLSLIPHARIYSLIKLVAQALLRLRALARRSIVVTRTPACPPSSGRILADTSALVGLRRAEVRAGMLGAVMAHP